MMGKRMIQLGVGYSLLLALTCACTYEEIVSSPLLVYPSVYSCSSIVWFPVHVHGIVLERLLLTGRQL